MPAPLTLPATTMVRDWFAHSATAYAEASAPIHPDDPRLAVLANGDDSALADLLSRNSPEQLAHMFAAEHAAIPPFPIRPPWCDVERLHLFFAWPEVTVVQSAQTFWVDGHSARVARDVTFELDDDHLPIAVYLAPTYMLVDEKIDLALDEVHAWTRAMGLAIGHYSARTVGAQR